MMHNQDISELLFKKLCQDLTPEEAARLESWLQESSENEQLYEELNNLPALMEQVRQYGLAQQEVNNGWEQMHARLVQEQPAGQGRVHRWRLIWYTAAALLLLCMSLLMFVWMKPTSAVLHPPIIEKVTQPDIPPITHTCLTPDGATIRSDSSKTGLLVK